MFLKEITQNNNATITNSSVIKDLEVGITIKEKDYTTSLDLVNLKPISEKSTEEICGKCCAICFTTALLCPFVICDLYFAFTDNSCSDQKYGKNDITMRSYLLASGIIGLVFILIVICRIWFIQLDDNQDKKVIINIQKSFKITCLKFFGWIYTAFHLSWLLVGCILFWGYMDISKCSESIYNYLFARFIIAIVGTVLSAKQNEL